MPATLPLILQTDLLPDVIPQACQLGKSYHPTPCQSPNSNLFQQLAFCLPECMRCASPITPYSSECRWVRAGPGHDAAPTRCRWWSTYPAHKGKVAFTHLCAGGMLGQHSSQGGSRGGGSPRGRKLGLKLKRLDSGEYVPRGGGRGSRYKPVYLSCSHFTHFARVKGKISSKKRHFFWALPK